MSDPFPIADALRLLRTRQQLTQSAASRRDGAPDFRTLSHWETRRKMPSLKLLYRYLHALGLDFADLQRALDQITGREDQASESLAFRVADLDRRLSELERQSRSPAEVSR